MIAYQTAAFAYQGAGQFAYQEIAAGPTQVTARALGSVEGGGAGKRRRRTYKTRDRDLVELMPLIMELLRRK